MRNWLRKVRQWLSNPVTASAGANLVVVAIGTTLVAGVGLVIEDLLPKDDPDALVVWWRWVFVCGSLLLLFGLLNWRGRMRRTTGTLFHIQILDEAFADLRSVAAAEARERKLTSRSITRWVDLEHRLSTSGVIELVDVCEQVGAAIEQQINDDAPETGYTVAPNILWPMALAVGSSLPLPKRIRLLELPTEHTPEIEVPLDDEPLSVKVFPVGDIGSAKRVGVWLAFSAAAKHYDWDELMPRFGVTAGRIIHLGRPPVKNTAPEPLTEKQMAGLGPAIAAALVEIRSKIGDTELVVVAMITKVAALSAGWHLAQKKCRFFANTFLMHFHETDFVPMRVKESQPTVAPTPTDA